MKRKSRENTALDLPAITFFDGQPRLCSEPFAEYSYFTGLRFYSSATSLFKLAGLLLTTVLFEPLSAIASSGLLRGHIVRPGTPRPTKAFDTLPRPISGKELLVACRLALFQLSFLKLLAFMLPACSTSFHHSLRHSSRSLRLSPPASALWSASPSLPARLCLSALHTPS